MSSNRAEGFKSRCRLGCSERYVDLGQGMETFMSKGNIYYCGPVGDRRVEKDHSGTANGLNHCAVL
jgi:hypothetical protein